MRLMDEHHSWAGLFEAFEHARRPNTDAIAQMALENYVEMREAVLDPEYRRKKAEAEELEKKDPNFIPRYSMVMFHPEIPYSDAQQAQSVAQVRSVDGDAEPQFEVADRRHRSPASCPSAAVAAWSPRRHSHWHRARARRSTWRRCRWRNPRRRSRLFNAVNVQVSALLGVPLTKAMGPEPARPDSPRTIACWPARNPRCRRRCCRRARCPGW